jgi:hypothetical protein
LKESLILPQKFNHWLRLPQNPFCFKKNPNPLNLKFKIDERDENIVKA